MRHDYDNDYDTSLEYIKERLTPEAMLELIFEYVAKISQEKNLDNLLMLMADLGRELVTSDRCTLWLVDEKNKELWTKVAHGIPEIRIPCDSGVVGHAIKGGEPVIINDAYSDERFNTDVDKKTAHHCRHR